MAFEAKDCFTIGISTLSLIGTVYNIVRARGEPRRQELLALLRQLDERTAGVTREVQAHLQRTSASKTRTEIARMEQDARFTLDLLFERLMPSDYTLLQREYSAWWASVCEVPFPMAASDKAIGKDAAAITSRQEAHSKFCRCIYGLQHQLHCDRLKLAKVKKRG